MVKSIAVAIIFSFLFFSVNAQQTDSDKKDSLGTARPAIVFNVSNPKPTSHLKKDIQPVKDSPVLPINTAPVNIKLTSDKKE